MKIAADKGNATRPSIKLGICGEHGGGPDSVKFFHKVGLTYVSCSPCRVPVARLAAAQAAIERKRAAVLTFDRHHRRIPGLVSLSHLELYRMPSSPFSSVLRRHEGRLVKRGNGDHRASPRTSCRPTDRLGLGDRPVAGTRAVIFRPSFPLPASHVWFSAWLQTRSPGGEFGRDPASVKTRPEVGTPCVRAERHARTVSVC